MSDGHPHSALREWRQHMGQPVTLVILAGIGAVLGLAGPFGTADRLMLVPRVAYWLAVVGLTYGVSALLSTLLAARLKRLPLPLRIGMQGLATGCAIAAIVVILNLMTFGWLPSRAEAPAFLGTLFAIALIITTAAHLVMRQRAGLGVADDLPRSGTGTGSGSGPTALPPPLLERLPLDKRGPLVALSVEDHYTRVRTTRGQGLLLMRLSDAIREVGETPGAQVHRSHWVAFGQVRAASRSGDRAMLTMSDGSEIPVSRANVPTIREAGLLPR